MNRPRTHIPATAQRLASPYDKRTSELKRIQADVLVSDYDYVFRGVLAGLRGAQDSILCTFFKALKDEIVREEIPTYYDVNNESRVAGILSRLNFRPVPTTTDPESLQGHALDTAHRSPSARPKSGGSEGVRKRAPRKTVKPADVPSGDSGGVRRNRKKDKGQEGQAS